MTESIRVGFAGIGNMGWPMARNLHAAGYGIAVYDLDPQRAERFVREHGGTAAATPADLARDANIVITMLPTGRDVASLVLGADGKGNASSMLAALRPGTVLVDMSSSDPVGTRELGAKLRDKGVALIDAPVSGLVARAETGQLTIMIGTDDEQALAIADPVLRRLGQRLFRVGSLGCGHAMKALNNVVSATAFIATAEALIVGKRFGLDPRVMTEIFSVSTGKSFHAEMTFPDHVLTRKFASGFSLGLLVKDVGIAGDLSGAVGARTPLIDLSRELWEDARAELGVAADNSAATQRWERLNDVILESPPRTAAQPK